MGGNAISQSVRLNSKEYFELWDNLKEKLKVLEGYNFILVEAYKNKESFGDLDCLVYAENYDPKLIFNAINAYELIRNGPVSSMAVKVEKGLFQIDFIYCPKEEILFSERYFSNNDLGNLLGKIAKRCGFKLGHNGFLYVLRDDENDKVIEEILVSDDWDSAISFIGYPKGRFTAENLDDIFKYAVNTPYFSKAPYQYENINHHSKVRDKKRTSYNKFLTWLKETDYPIKEFDWTNKTELRKQFLYKSFDLFPEFKKKYDAAIIKNNNIKSAKDKFNGEIIKNLIPTLEGKRLGQFITSFKKSREEKGDFINYINNLSKEEVEQQILWHISIFNMETDKEMAKNEYKNI